MEEFVSIMKGIGATSVIVQTELCPTSARKHYQASALFKKGKVRLTEKLSRTKYKNLCHTEPLIDIDKSLEYCTKPETRVPGTEPINWNWPRPKPTECLVPLDTIRPLQQLRPWQAQLMRMLRRTPDARKILWIVDSEGGAGKSALVRHLTDCWLDAVIVSGKKDNIFNQLLTLANTSDQVFGVIMYDVPRCASDFVSYDSVEKIKDGMFYSGKYEGGVCKFSGHPHVVVFSNQMPKLHEMSVDRWAIFKPGPVGLVPVPALTLTL